jgi:hypothetical protein
MDDTDSTAPLPTWPAAAARSALAVGLILPAALVLNVLIGRTIHWDIAGAIAALAFVVLTLAYRYAR